MKTRRRPEISMSATTLSFLSVLIWLIGCAPGETAQTLADRFYRVSGDEAGGSFERHASVRRDGTSADAMTLVAPVAIRAGLAGISGRFTLRLLAAPVFNVGDGMQLNVILGEAGVRQPVSSRYFDAGRREADRHWATLEVPLELRGSADTYLEIRLSGGPQGDLVADWLALADARLDPAGRF